MGEIKPGWKRWRFDQIAQSVTERVDNPNKAGVEHYIGLEHLDSESLKIRRWGSPNDVSSTKLLFEPGDTIFGRRRAYQRKLGVAEFRGISSAHALVLRAKAGVALPEFLPFFMQSATFMERAVKISVGGLSPTINWKTLAKQEFALPPLEEQLRFLRVLKPALSTYEGLKDALEQAILLEKALVETYQRGNASARHPAVGAYDDRWKLKPVDSVLLDTQYGLSVAPKKSGAYPILRMMNIEEGWVVENDLKFVDLGEADYQRYLLSPGDVLFNRTNSIDLVGRTGVYGLDGEHVFASYLVRLKANPELVLPEYLCAFLNEAIGRRQVLSFATKGVSQANVNAKNLRRVLLPLPPIEHQNRLVRALRDHAAGRGSLRARASEAWSIIMAVLNGIAQ